MNNGHFWATYVQNVVLPEFALFKDIVTNKVLRVFASLGREAEQVAEQRWQQLLEQPGDEDTDLSDIAEQAMESGIDFYVTSKGIQQGTNNLMAVALHHLHEQQLLYIHRRELLAPFEEDLEGLLKIDEVNKRLKTAGVDIEQFATWNQLEVLRMVANVVKHGDGTSATKLRLLRPWLFVAPSPTMTQTLTDLPPRSQVFRPLIGEDLYVTEADLDGYFDAVEQFWQALRDAIVKDA